MSIQAGDLKTEAGANPAEHLTFTYEIASETDDRGVMIARPSHATVTVRRSMLRQDGKLPLLALAIASQRFNLKVREKQKHPRGAFIATRVAGRQTVPLYQVDIEDFQPDEIRITWQGTGNDNLEGCNIIEEITLIASAGKYTDLTTNKPAPFDVRQV
jgi:hypothetical protein